MNSATRAISALPFSLFLEEVLDRLDVVIGARFDRLDRGAVGLGEFRDHRVELFERRGGKLGDFLDRGFGGERFEPLDFDLHAVADQAQLAEMPAQRLDLGVIAPVERGQGRERGERHGDY